MFSSLATIEVPERCMPVTHTTVGSVRISSLMLGPPDGAVWTQAGPDQSFAEAEPAQMSSSTTVVAHT
jgi:hypothetical protein